MKRSFTLQLAATSYCCIKTHIILSTTQIGFYRKKRSKLHYSELIWYNEKKNLFEVFVITINTSQS